jgi:hypothetical protein
MTGFENSHTAYAYGPPPHQYGGWQGSGSNGYGGTMVVPRNSGMSVPPPVMPQMRGYYEAAPPPVGFHASVATHMPHMAPAAAPHSVPGGITLVPAGQGLSGLETQLQANGETIQPPNQSPDSGNPRTSVTAATNGATSPYSTLCAEEQAAFDNAHNREHATGPSGLPEGAPVAVPSTQVVPQPEARDPFTPSPMMLEPPRGPRGGNGPPSRGIHRVDVHHEATSAAETTLLRIQEAGRLPSKEELTNMLKALSSQHPGPVEKTTEAAQAQAVKHTLQWLLDNYDRVSPAKKPVGKPTDKQGGNPQEPPLSKTLRDEMIGQVQRQLEEDGFYYA